MLIGQAIKIVKAPNPDTPHANPHPPSTLVDDGNIYKIVDTKVIDGKYCVVFVDREGRIFAISSIWCRVYWESPPDELFYFPESQEISKQFMEDQDFDAEI